MSLTARTWRALLGLAAGMAALLFIPAGTFRYAEAWIYLAIFLGASTLITARLMVADRALLERRMRGGPWRELRPAQRNIMTGASVAFLALLIVPALDHRFGWSHVPPGVTWAGDALVAIGLYLVSIVYRENTFLSARIEIAQNQTVVSTGSYAIVRHPMYATSSLYILGTPLALGSYWGFVPAVAMVPFLIWRLLDEERLLTRSLAGYSDYRKKVRYRLVPRVW